MLENECEKKEVFISSRKRRKSKKLFCGEKISLIMRNWRGTDVIVEAYLIDATPSSGDLLLHLLRREKNTADMASRWWGSCAAICRVLMIVVPRISRGSRVSGARVRTVKVARRNRRRTTKGWLLTQRVACALHTGRLFRL